MLRVTGRIKDRKMKGMITLIVNMMDVNMKARFHSVSGERSRGAALDLFFSPPIVNFLFSSFGQEVEGDVTGRVHPDCLIYPECL